MARQKGRRKQSLWMLHVISLGNVTLVEEWTEEGSPCESTGKEIRMGRSNIEKQLGRQSIENKMVPTMF